MPYNFLTGDPIQSAVQSLRGSSFDPTGSALDDLSSESLEMTPEPQNTNNMIDILSSVYNIKDTTNLKEFINNVAEIESSGGTDTVSDISSARGIFQFLTKGEGNAFVTGLNRTKATYKARGLEVPSWVEEAKDHGDPNLLSTEQQVELFLANLYQQKGTDKLFKRILSGDRNAQKEMYGKYHHTIPDITKNKRLKEIFR
mgnify:CR=1 FL=1